MFFFGCEKESPDANTPSANNQSNNDNNTCDSDSFTVENFWSETIIGDNYDIYSNPRYL